MVLGNAAVARRRGGYIHSPSEEEESSTSDATSDSDDSEVDISEPGEKEMVVLESAMLRIQRAQARDKVQVKLSREELIAWGRHQERERARERRQRQRERQDMISVPIEHLGTMSRSFTKLPTPSVSGDDDGSPQRVPGSFQHEDRQGLPPIGYFPPPGAPSRTLPSSSSQPVLGSAAAERQRADSPFTYSYVHDSATARHVSDPVANATNATGYVNPFQYQTSGPRAPQYMSRAAAMGRNGSSATEMIDGTSYARGPAAAPAAARGRRVPPRHDTESSEDDDDTASEESSDEDEDEDDDDPRRRPTVHNTRSRAKQYTASTRSTRKDDIVIVDPDSEPEPEPEPVPRRVPNSSRSTKTTKKPSRSSSSATAKHKSNGASSSGSVVPSLHSSRRRKGK